MVDMNKISIRNLRICMVAPDDGCPPLLTVSPMCVTALLFSLIKSLYLTKRLGT